MLLNVCITVAAGFQHGNGAGFRAQREVGRFRRNAEVDEQTK